MPRPSVEVERREQILVATCEVIAELGMHEMRLADVAKRAGVSSGMLHYYFDSKRALLVAAFEHNFGRSLDRRRALMSTEQPALAVLQRLIETYLPRDQDTLVAWKVWAELWGEAMRDRQFQEVNERLYGEWRGLVVEILARAQREGSARPGDPVELANMLVAMVDGLAVQVLAQSSAMPVATMHDTLRAFVATTLAQP